MYYVWRRHACVNILHIWGTQENVDLIFVIAVFLINQLEKLKSSPQGYDVISFKLEVEKMPSGTTI